MREYTRLDFGVFIVCWGTTTAVTPLTVRHTPKDHCLGNSSATQPRRSTLGPNLQKSLVF
jgi:hypothetical protein